MNQNIKMKISLVLLAFTVIAIFPGEGHARKKKRAPNANSEDSFSLVARSWDSNSCDRSAPQALKDTIEKACKQAKASKVLNQPALEKFDDQRQVQCILTSESGFLEVALGTQQDNKFLIEPSRPVFKIDPKGSLYALSQNGENVETNFCNQLEDEISSKKSSMNYEVFRAVFANEYSPQKNLAAEQFFGQLSKVNLCYRHDPVFAKYRCDQKTNKQKRDVSEETPKKSSKK